MFVREWDLGPEETLVFVIFEDGGLYHSIARRDSEAPASCPNPRRISLSLLTSYDYAALRRGREPAKKLDPAEVARHWRATQERAVEYDVEHRGTPHGAVACSFAVTGERDKLLLLTEMRLIQYKSSFFDVVPRTKDQQETANWLFEVTYDLARRASAR